MAPINHITTTKIEIGAVGLPVVTQSAKEPSDSINLEKKEIIRAHTPHITRKITKIVALMEEDADPYASLIEVQADKMVSVNKPQATGQRILLIWKITRIIRMPTGLRKVELPAALPKVIQRPMIMRICGTLNRMEKNMPTPVKEDTTLLSENKETELPSKSVSKMEVNMEEPLKIFSSVTKVYKIVKIKNTGEVAARLRYSAIGEIPARATGFTAETGATTGFGAE